jgi:hypothetical protein
MARASAIAKIGLGGVAAGLLLAQVVVVPRTNPPPDGALAPPPAIEAILRRACYDCHSNETRWPWYTRVAPLSWVIADHVSAGRRQVNFSEWGGYYPVTRRHKLQWIGRAVRDAQMPPWTYRLIHRDARLSDADRGVLAGWVDSTQASLSIESGTK